MVTPAAEPRPQTRNARNRPDWMKVPALVITAALRILSGPLHDSPQLLPHALAKPLAPSYWDRTRKRTFGAACCQSIRSAGRGTLAQLPWLAAKRRRA